ncbi:gamma-glutamylcyclotransferase [Aliarcobacter vitoriensis]|uniref:Gamma-glutamylcyclotransferase n=1 Tax=Aliarcobacter vitoriensis TaxID=2011099 RepID=A0A366MT83_9BACT|nr:gamma-glutamylcyclotransferase [Aliarcobacter vitoriensis]RBQ28709.1 gamma-glutamylcyclotransferase [Aliarcobacter vitoriensis]
MYIFGFGSLINIKSAQNSFKNRELKKDDLIPIRIKGYKRAWNALESINFENIEVNGVFLNIQKDENSTIFGVMIKVSNEEFEVLKKREKNYSCIRIKKEDILNLQLEDDVFAFMTTNKEKIAKVGDINTFIPSKYIEIVQEGIKNFSKEFQSDFDDILKDFPFPLKSGNYSFNDPIQNQAAREAKNHNESN